jgi:hypothetical protein
LLKLRVNEEELLIVGHNPIRVNVQSFVEVPCLVSGGLNVVIGQKVKYVVESKTTFSALIEASESFRLSWWECTCVGFKQLLLGKHLTHDLCLLLRLGDRLDEV